MGFIGGIKRLFFGNIPMVRDHLNLIVLVGVGAAVLPVVLGGLWRLSRGMFKKQVWIYTWLDTIVQQEQPKQAPEAKHQVIWLQAEAPVKPATGLPCNGCGVCCAAEPCPVAGIFLWQWKGACRALRWSGQERQYRCGLFQQPESYLPWLNFLPELMRLKFQRMIGRKIAAGIACDSDSTSEVAVRLE